MMKAKPPGPPPLPKDDDTKHPGGRPTEYKPEYAAQAKAMCSMGATIEQLARHFDVSISTVHNWRNTHAEFLDALKVGRDDADSLVERSLYEKALNGDTTAMIFWLKNRKRAEWKDRVDHNHSGNISNLTDEELDARARELVEKANQEGK